MEVAQKVSSDSLIVAAILVDAASQKRIKRSKRRVGGGHRYYYYPEQQQVLQKRINSILTPDDKEMIQKILNEKVLCELSVSPQDVSILSGLEDLIQGFTFEYDNKIIRGWSSPNIPEDKARDDILKKLKPVEPEVKPEPKEVPIKAPEVKKKPPEEEKPRKEEKEKPKRKEKESPEKEERESEEDLKEKIRREILEEIKGSFVDNVIQALEKHQIDIKEQRTVKKGKEYELEVSVPTALGRQNYLVRIFDSGKKKTGSKDIYSLGMDAISRKMPAIAISSTGFAKTAIKKWKEELHDFMILMTEDDLEIEE